MQLAGAGFYWTTSIDPSLSFATSLLLIVFSMMIRSVQMHENRRTPSGMLGTIQINAFFRNRCQRTGTRRVVLVKQRHTILTATIIHKSDAFGNTGHFFTHVVILGFIIVILGINGEKVMEGIRELKPLTLASKEAFNFGRGWKEHIEIVI